MTIRYRRGLRDTFGNEAHAATFIRRRLILLDSELRGNKSELCRVLLHERFHFAWVRLGNPRRLAWESVLRAEWDAGARGETGWSAELRKRKLTGAAVAGRSLRWRDYCCESFCDTGAWVFGGSDGEVTLARRHRRGRLGWFEEEFATGCIAI